MTRGSSQHSTPRSRGVVHSRPRLSPGTGSEVRGPRASWARAAWIGLLLVTPATAEKLTIVMAPAPGDTLIYKMQVQQEMSFQGMTITGTEGGKVHIVVQESHEDTLQLSIHFSDFEGSVKNGNDLVERKPQLQGVALLARMSPRGDVLEVKPQTPVAPNLKEELPRILEEFFPFFADQAIEPGDSWTRIQKVPNKDSANDELRIDGKTEYTLDELSKKNDRKTAKILGVESAKVNFETPAGVVVGDVKGKSEALVLVDSGWVLERKSTSEFTGTVGATKGSRVEYTEIQRLR